MKYNLLDIVVVELSNFTAQHADYINVILISTWILNQSKTKNR